MSADLGPGTQSTIWCSAVDKDVGRLAGRTLQERMRLLSVLVVGGGPTGVEFCGELGDFIRSVR